MMLFFTFECHFRLLGYTVVFSPFLEELPFKGFLTLPPLPHVINLDFCQDNVVYALFLSSHGIQGAQLLFLKNITTEQNMISRPVQRVTNNCYIIVANQ